ncbi:MAG: hypothetical protein GY771_11315 [bacterium]|nr:hypothetical protein [bacterium]
MRLSILVSATIYSVIIAGCGPTVEQEYLYLAREGDTVRAISLRLTDSEKPATEIAEYNLLAPDAAFDTPTLIRINNSTVKKNRGNTTLLEEYGETRAKLLRYELGTARKSYDNLSIEADDPSVRYEAAITSYLLGNFDETRSYNENDGDITGFELLHACCLSGTGDLAKAEDRLLSRLLNEPDDRRSKYLLGEVLRRQRRYTGARTAYFDLLLDDESDVIAGLTRASIERAIREEMSYAKEQLDKDSGR